MASQLSEFRSRAVQTSNGSAETQPEVIQKLDKQELSWFHLKVILVAGMGFFCDAYDIFVISYITKTIGRVYYPDHTYYSPELCESLDLGNATCSSNYAKYAAAGISPTAAAVQVPSAMPANITAAIQATVLIGTLVGQVTFGYLGDRFGRKPMFGLSLALLIFGAIAQGLSFGSSANGVIATLCLWRFVLGFGIGGDYPLSSTYMSEYAGRDNRGMLVAAIFSMQGIGILVAATVTIIAASCFSGYPESADYLWRAVLMFGSIPAIATMYFRLNLPETPRYTVYADNNVERANAEMAEFVDTQKVEAAIISLPKPPPKVTFSEFMGKFGWQLLGTASTWFFLDIAFYSQNFFQSDIYTHIGWLPPAYTYDPIQEAYYVARANAIIALCSTIPGYFVTVFTIEKLGRIPIQITGFIMMTLMMLILASAYTTLIANAVPAFIVLYALAFFFANFGPNATTFIIPAELYPTRYRSFGHGFSAACGKSGAILGTFGFAASSTAIGLQQTLGIMVIVNFLGLCFTFFVPETKGRSLEEISGDEVEGSKTFGEMQKLPSSASDSKLIDRDTKEPLDA